MTAEPRDAAGNQIRFREATDDHRPRLIQLINAAFSVETFLEGTRTDDERLAAMMAKGIILMAEDGAGQLLGCVYTEQRGKRGYLCQLAVDPAHQGTGLARRIVSEAENRIRAQGSEAVDITVLSMRPQLVPIYRRFGYMETGTEEFEPTQPLKTGVDCHCIVMSKRL